MRRLIPLLFLLLTAPGFAHAADAVLPLEEELPSASVVDVPDTLFRGQVLEVLEEQDVPSEEDGGTAVQQKLKVRIHDGPFAGQEVVFDGMALEVIGANRYRAGEEVMVWWSKDVDGTDVFYVTDYVRDWSLLWMALAFALAVVAVGRWQGARALLALAFSFAVILQLVLPAILAGQDPVFVATGGAALILTVGIFLTHGFQHRSYLSLAGVGATLIVTAGLSFGFSAWARLSGFGSEESYYLSQMLGATINMKGIFLAGVMIGALGVLDDIVVSQVAVVEEIRKANPDLTALEVFRRAMRVGVDHASAVTNTLFLAYAGASLPLLLLFSVKQAPFLSVRDVLNNELVAAEVVRTLVGSIGLLLAVPITTAIAARFSKKRT